MLEIIKQGLETSIQDFPGRIGYWEQGIPPSGPFDMWSHRLANLLVGNTAGAAALECQFLGPTLTFHREAVIAVTGADMEPKLDGEPIRMWEGVSVKAGQTLELAAARKGARSYIAVSGGIETPPMLGSRSTFDMAGIGGVDGHAIKNGQTLPLGEGDGRAGRRIRSDCRPTVDGRREWTIEAVPGPNDDWIDDDGHNRFLSSEWKLQAKSNRTGLRLEGPRWTFTEIAKDKRPEHGQDPSNILDHGYPFGAVNLCGQTPIILVNDGPSTGGFINPYTIPTAAFWKLAQSRPGDTYQFVSISLADAQEARRQIEQMCGEESLEDA